MSTENKTKPGSDNLLEMFMERDPAKWAAHQIAAKSHPEIKTIGEAMAMIEKVINTAFEMKTWQQTAALQTSHAELLHWAKFQQKKYPRQIVRGRRMRSRTLKV